MRLKEKIYIFYRILKAFFNSLCFYACRVFSIDNKLVSVCSFEGKGGFGCNPKYVVQALHKKDKNIKFVWFVNKNIFNKKNFPEYIKKVSNTLWNRAYWLSKSKIWIDNYRKPYGTKKRKRQYYLNVNHYTIGIKCTGLYRGEGFSEMAYLVSKNDSDMVDNFVIDSKWCEEISPKALVYKGTYLKTGAPRCDILYGDRLGAKENFRRRHNIPVDSKVVMFAPTFREGAKDGVRYVYSELWTVNFKQLIVELEKKFGGTWYICTRVHPQLAPTFKKYNNPELQDRIIDESQADDMYEILAGMDAYITDYSSACFEAGFAYIPVFLYADDIQEYAKERGCLMWNMATDPRDHIGNNKEITPMFNIELPFTFARTNDELWHDIEVFDFEIYKKKLHDFFDSIGLVFDGKANEKICNRIIEVLYEYKQL